MTLSRPHLPQPLVEGYAFEVIQRSRNISAECKGLLSKNYASDTPIHLAGIIRDTCSYLEEVALHIYENSDWNDKEKAGSNLELLQKTDWLIREIGSAIRFVDGAQTHKLPWSFIRPLEDMVARFMPVFVKDIDPGDLEVMLRPKWKYNYTVHLGNLYQLFTTQLSNFSELKPLPEWVDQYKTKCFHIISFPYIERKDILLHCLLGHEMGHFATGAFLTKEREGAFLHAAINARSLVADDPKDPSLVREACEAWGRGAQELLSDIAGAILFGPALLLAMLEVALQDSEGLDCLPEKENQYYPPWRMRLRVILKVLKEMQLIPLPKGQFPEDLITVVNDRFHAVEEIVDATSDQANIDKDPSIRFAYEEIAKLKTVAQAEFLTKLDNAGLAAREDELYEIFCPDLIERLRLGIPPNAIEPKTGDGHSVRIVHIVNAAWFFRLTEKERLSSTSLDQLSNKTDTLNRLCLKAIEYSFITSEYNRYMKSGEA